MKLYIREVLIPEYAKSFNEGLSAEDIKFYGKDTFQQKQVRKRTEYTLSFGCQPQRPIQ